MTDSPALAAHKLEQATIEANGMARLIADYCVKALGDWSLLPPTFAVVRYEEARAVEESARVACQATQAVDV